MVGYAALELDTLDYLIPPVKKSRGSFKTELLFSQNFPRKTDVRLIKDVHKKITREIVSHPLDVQASASVILKKTTKTSHKYFTSNNNSKTERNTKYLNVNTYRTKELIEEKPMIKVTIIPRETQNRKIAFNKHRERTKELQNTVSNQENSIKSKNIYFVVKGKRREKVYELRSSESTNFSNNLCNTKHEDISLQQITNSRRLINSLNMEKKKRKNRKIVPSNTTFNVLDSPNLNNLSDSKALNSHKSKVTIVGQLGLTRDDQYILKCAATVNDKPIETNYLNLKKNKDFLNVNTNAKTPQNSNTQTEICYSDKCINLKGLYHNEQRMNSQGTQVNIAQRDKNYKNKIVQCSCDILTADSNVFNIGKQDYVLKSGKNPLVVISVYPKNDNEDNAVKNIYQPIKLQKKGNNIDNNNMLKGRKLNQQNNRVLSVNTSVQRSLRSRSPSPGATKQKIPNKILTDITTKRERENKNSNRINIIASQSQNNRNKFINTKKDSTCTCPDTKNAGKQEFLNLDVSSKINDITENNSKQVKRALVNHFLKSVDNLNVNDANMKKFTPKNDTSRVTINIDGEKEHYDLLIEQSNFDTGLAIRKSIKKPSQIFRTEGTVSMNSMENYLTLSDDTKNGTSINNARQTCDIQNNKPIHSRLNIRDSLIISHSREGRNYTRSNANELKNKAEDFKTASISSNLRVPVKHFRGDECSIVDPDERDKEIRALLGIVKNTKNPKKDEFNVTKDLKVSHSHPENQKGKTERSCYVKRSKSLVTKISVSRSAQTCIKIMRDKNKRISNDAVKTNEARMIEEIIFQAPQQKKILLSEIDNSSSVVPLKEMINEQDERNIIEKQIYDCKNKDLNSQVNVEKSVQNQKLILNRNVQLFLHIGRFTEQKPITLTRKQYEKVKRTIKCTKYHKSYFNYYNVVSVGEIRIKSRLQRRSYDREVQTDRSEINRTVTCKQIQCNSNHNEPYERNIDKFIFTADTTNDNNLGKVIIDKKIKPEAVTRQTVSSVDVRYTKTSKKNNTISATCFGDGLLNDISQKSPNPKNSPSLFTIFKGHRKCVSPNLGTSIYSLYSEANESTKYDEVNQPSAGDAKPKPFFRRLLSCLVMRTPETTGFNEARKRKVSHVNSSVDAYHISTSLGAMEMTSSLYDTSASFYSNHITVPTSKMKRSFFTSVWGLLSVRRS